MSGPMIDHEKFSTVSWQGVGGEGGGRGERGACTCRHTPSYDQSRILTTDNFCPWHFDPPPSPTSAGSMDCPTHLYLIYTFTCIQVHVHVGVKISMEYHLTMIISLNSLETSIPRVIQAMTFCTAWRYRLGSFWTSGLRNRALSKVAWESTSYHVFFTLTSAPSLHFSSPPDPTLLALWLEEW